MSEENKDRMKGVLIEISRPITDGKGSGSSALSHSSNPKSRRFDDNSILRLGLFQNGPGFILERPRSNNYLDEFCQS